MFTGGLMHPPGKDLDVFCFNGKSRRHRVAANINQEILELADPVDDIKSRNGAGRCLGKLLSEGNDNRRLCEFLYHFSGYKPDNPFMKFLMVNEDELFFAFSDVRVQGFGYQ